MPVKIKRRLPAVPSLSKILPKGAEGGKEFARIVDLLLSHEARRAGKKFTIFDDAAGDYLGLDSFEGDPFSGTIGYQYKFFSSPLCSDHRVSIKEALATAAENRKKLELEKWVLVIPDDLTDSATRKDGGDLSWFESLRKEHNYSFQLEYLGHKKLQGLFLQTPSLCLFYYPDLVIRSAAHKKSLQDTRRRYDANMCETHGHIDFVGMSVYKDEATRGVPMEHIYIPLSAIQGNADDRDADTPRTNPLEFLRPGAKHVILGDPGSGKSTLLRFLALVGISEPLQRRSGAKADGRLAVLVTLRRYADELKERRNLSLIDYIIEMTQADFTLKAASLEFFEYALETGRTLLLFDGLDELPNPQFKQLVSSRIRSLVTTYPGNTILISSRLAGYESPFRFDEKQFQHFKLARLRLPEIEQFIDDWYAVRIQHKPTQRSNVEDLVRIVRDDSYTAIRELAENPLLLTIVALVHRIEAVLPDERVVLYQKCTETLLSTWHKWKYRDESERLKGKDERRNRRRIEAIAHWMQCRSSNVHKGQRAVASHEDLRHFLTDHIETVERTRNPHLDAIDMAENFLEFVKKRAGLLIEIGDRQYGFIHLTFQEYLAAEHIITCGEKDGIAATWKSIKAHCDDPTWFEVIRLLVANLKSEKSQEALVQMVSDSEPGERRKSARYLLLGGLLLDGIESAEARQTKIIQGLLRSSAEAKDAEDLRPFVSTLREVLARIEDNASVIEAFRNAWQGFEQNSKRVALALVAAIIEIPLGQVFELADGTLSHLPSYPMLLRFFLDEEPFRGERSSFEADLTMAFAIDDYRLLDSPGGNQRASMNQAFAARFNPRSAPRRYFDQQLVAMAGGEHGPFRDHTFNCLKLFFGSQPNLDSAAIRVRDLELDTAQDRTLAQVLVRVRAQALARVPASSLALDQTRDLAPVQSPASDRDLALDRFLDLSRPWAMARARALDRALARALHLDRARALDQPRARPQDPVRTRTHAQLWDQLLNEPAYYRTMIGEYCEIFNLRPEAHWVEALRVCFLPRIPQLVAPFYNLSYWEQVEGAFATRNSDPNQCFAAAWLLLVDTWLFLYEVFDKPEDSPFQRLGELTRGTNEPQMRIAHCIRDLAYGDESRISDLVAMVRSPDRAYREIFERCLWR